MDHLAIPERPEDVGTKDSLVQTVQKVEPESQDPKESKEFRENLALMANLALQDHQDQTIFLAIRVVNQVNKFNVYSFINKFFQPFLVLLIYDIQAKGLCAQKVNKVRKAHEALLDQKGILVNQETTIFDEVKMEHLEILGIQGNEARGVNHQVTGLW